MAEREGIEPTSASSLADNGFEDRGGHQALLPLLEENHLDGIPHLLCQRSFKTRFLPINEPRHLSPIPLIRQ